MSNEVKNLMAALAAAFEPAEVKFKPGVVSGNRALALPYVDARVVQDRLDDVLGLDTVSELLSELAGTWSRKEGPAAPIPPMARRREATYCPAPSIRSSRLALPRFPPRAGSRGSCTCLGGVRKSSP